MDILLNTAGFQSAHQPLKAYVDDEDFLEAAHSDTDYWHQLGSGVPESRRTREAALGAPAESEALAQGEMSPYGQLFKVARDKARSAYGKAYTKSIKVENKKKIQKNKKKKKKIDIAHQIILFLTKIITNADKSIKMNGPNHNAYVAGSIGGL